jgi:dynein heavy chain
MDQMVEEAFRLNVKYSLQELSKAVNGDGKAAPNPLFKVKVVLKNNKVFQVLVQLVPPDTVS